MLPSHGLELSPIALSRLGNGGFHSGQPSVQVKIEISVIDNGQGGGPLTISAINIKYI